MAAGFIEKPAKKGLPSEDQALVQSLVLKLPLEQKGRLVVLELTHSMNYISTCFAFL